MKTILITGAASGIGAAIARRVASQNVNLLLHSRSNAEGLNQVAEQARLSGSKVSTVLSDLSDSDAAEYLVKSSVNTFAALDQIVSNAGFAERGKLGEVTFDNLLKSEKTMPEAFFKIVSSAIPFLTQSNCGRVVAISSFVAHVFDEDGLFPSTAAAKASLEALAKSLAAQLASSGVTVNCIAPGYTRKDGGHSAIPEKAWQLAASKIPMGRIGTPDDSAAAVAFLLSDDAQFITGQTIHVDGGLSLR